MTTTEPATDPALEARTPSDDAEKISGSWETAQATFKERFPRLKEGILFCIWKLEQDPRLTLKDFRDEARLRGIPLGGRSLHSARVALGIESPTPPRPKREPAVGARARPGQSRARQTDTQASLEAQLLAGVQQIQQAAGAEATRLREAMRDAIGLLQKALEG